MMRTPILTLVAAGLLVSGLSGCASLRNSFGMNKQAPDEFSVVREAPLVMPPDFALRPPKPGAPRPQDVDAQGQALQALFGDGVAPPPKSRAETSLLDRAGAGRVSADVRSTLRDDGTQMVDKAGFLKDLLSAPAGVAIEGEATIG